MNRRTSKVIERPVGTGEICKAGEHVAGVLYRLEVRQEILISESLNGQQELPGQLEISGEVTVSEAERMQAQVMQIMNSGSLLTLHLSDGRTLDIYAPSADPISGTYRVTGGSSGLVKR